MRTPFTLRVAKMPMTGVLDAFFSLAWIALFAVGIAKAPPPAGSTEEDALLRTIFLKPEEDVARLVYADWLDEHDRPLRAEFIRLQVRLATIAADDSELSALNQREAELLKDPRATEVPKGFAPPISDRSLWPGEPPEGVLGTPMYRRGFLESIEFMHDTFVERAEEAAQKAPFVRKVSIVSPQHLVSQPAELPLATLGRLTVSPQIEELAFRKIRFEPSDIERLNRAAPNLKRLALNGATMNIVDLAQLIEAPIGARLTHLTVSDFYLVGAAPEVRDRLASALATLAHRRHHLVELTSCLHDLLPDTLKSEIRPVEVCNRVLASLGI